MIWTPHGPVAAQMAQFYQRVTVLYTKPMVVGPECFVFQAFSSPERCGVPKDPPGKDASDVVFPVGIAMNR